MAVPIAIRSTEAECRAERKRRLHAGRRRFRSALGQALRKDYRQVLRSWKFAGDDCLEPEAILYRGWLQFRQERQAELIAQ